MNGFSGLLVPFVWRGLRRERARSLLTMLGIALGVAVVTAVRLADRSSVEAFRAGIGAVTGDVSLEVYSPSGQIDEQRVADLLWLEEFGDWAPVIERGVLVPDGGTGAAGQPTGEVALAKRWAGR